MFKLLLPQLNKSIEARLGDNLMKTLINNQIPVASSCQGDGVCGKCVLNISSKLDIPVTPLEKKLKKKHDWTESQRASCQVKITSNLKVTSTYW